MGEKGSIHYHQGISSAAEKDIMKNAMDIIKNTDILSKTPQLLSKMEIYYQKSMC
jgi:hypothetical protein